MWLAIQDIMDVDEGKQAESPKPQYEPLYADAGLTAAAATEVTDDSKSKEPDTVLQAKKFMESMQVCASARGERLGSGQRCSCTPLAV